MNHILFPEPIGLDGYQTLLGSCSDVERLRVSHGNLVRQYTVANISTVGPNLRFVLTHNSRENSLGTVGRNWRHNAMAQLTISSSLVTYTDGQGRTHDYEFDIPTSTWKLTADSLFLRMTLTQVGSQWKLAEFAHGDTMVFDSNGRLQQLVDAHAQALTFTYTGALLTSISEPTGRSLTLTYSAGLLTKITDPRSMDTTLDYDANSNLTSIVSPEGCKLSYGYAPGSSNGLILSRTDAGNKTYTYEYNEGDGSLARLTNPLSQAIAYAYDSVSEASSHPHIGGYRQISRTKLTDAEGQVWDYRFDLYGNLWRILDPLQHSRRLYWSDQQTLLFVSEGFGVNSSGWLGPLDSPYNRYTRNIFDSLANPIAAIDANGVIRQMEYDIDSRLVAVTPARATLAVGGEWFDHFGKDGFLMCSALSSSGDLWQKPAYVDSSGILPGESDGSNAFERALPLLPNHQLDTRAPWIRMPGSPVRDTYRRTLGQWKNQGTNPSFTFRIPISTTGAFNLSLYTHCADQPYYQDNVEQWEQTYAGSFGRDVEILVSDIDPLSGNPRRQKFRMPNTGAGVWMTFGVYATASSTIRVKVRSRVINADQYPVISCIAFDPSENRRTTLSYTGPDLTRVTNPLGQATSMEFNSDGTLQKVTDAKARDTQFFYLDSAKNLTKILDANSGEVLLTYDNNGNVLTSRDQDLRTSSMEYDGKNRLIKATDPLNHATEFLLDPAGNLIGVKDARLRTTVMAYNELNRLVKITDVSNQETLLEYDATGRLTRVTDALSRSSQFFYDAAGRRVQTQLADGSKILYVLNAVNRLVSITGPNASRSNWADIDLSGSLNVLDNPGAELEEPSAPNPNAPQHWNYSDDYVGSSKTRSSAEAHSGSYSLEAATGKQWRQNNIASYAGGRYLAQAWAKKGAAGATTVTASIAGQVRNFGAALEVQTDASQATPIPASWTELKPQVIQVPGDSQATRISPPLARLELRCEKTSAEDAASSASFDDATLHLLSTCLEYDGENLREVATPDGARFRREFDRAGRLSMLTDPQGRTVWLVRDGLDRVVAVRDSLGNQLAYGFDASGQLVTFTDCKNQLTAFEYDLLDRLVKITYSDTSSEQFAYSAAGDLVSATDNLGQVRTFVYDFAHRLIEVHYPVGSQTLLLAYDEVGNLTQRSERNGDVEVCTYDNLNRLTRCQLTPGAGSLAQAADLTSVYDAVGNRTQLGPTAIAPAVYGTALYGVARYGQPAAYWSVPGGGLDSMNRLTAFSDSQSNSTGLAYDVEGRRTSVTCPNGTLTAATYDFVGRLLGLRTSRSSSELLNLRYDYNLASDRLALQTELASCTYHLDAGGRLIQETVNRWVTEHGEHLAQGELSGCLLDTANQRVQLLGVADDFSQLHLDRWKPVVREQDFGGYYYYNVRPHVAGPQIRAHQGLHLIFPSAWTQHVYTDGAPLHDPLGYLMIGLSEELELRRKLQGDFDLVMEWDGFDLASPGLTSPEINRYPTSLLSLGVVLPDGSNLCYVQRAFARNGYENYGEQNYYHWVYPGVSSSSVTSDYGGKFRIRRQGSALNLYYWNTATSSWTNCAGNLSSGYTTDDVRLLITGVGVFNFRVLSLAHANANPVNYSSSAGSYSSCLYDAGQSVQWSRLAWTETLAANTDVQFQLAFSNSESGPWSYLGPDGTAGTYFTTPAGEALPNTSAFAGRYARFQARLSSTEGLHTPSFGNVHLSFTGTGLLASSVRNFAYDAAGNITSIVTVTDSGSSTDDRNPAAHPINALNQVLQRDVGGASWLFSYDLNGNLTGKTDGTHTFTYTWSDDNRLIRVQGPSSLDVAFTYDTSGRMMSRTSGGVVTRFVWDGFDCVREVSAGPDIVYHIPDGTLHSFSLNGVVYQVHACALGSVRMITDASGAVVARLEYGAWGEEIFVSAIPALANFPYRFVGGLGVRTDEETGLVYMRARHYDASLQRFISRDPIGLRGGANLFTYVGNNPTRAVDPSGLNPTVVIHAEQIRNTGLSATEFANLQRDLQDEFSNELNVDIKWDPLGQSKSGWNDKRDTLNLEIDFFDKDTSDWGYTFIDKGLVEIYMNSINNWLSNKDHCPQNYDTKRTRYNFIKNMIKHELGHALTDLPDEYESMTGNHKVTNRKDGSVMDYATLSTRLPLLAPLKYSPQMVESIWIHLGMPRANIQPYEYRRAPYP